MSLTLQVRTVPGREVGLDPIEQVEHVVAVRARTRPSSPGSRGPSGPGRSGAAQGWYSPQSCFQAPGTAASWSAVPREDVAAVEGRVRLLAQRLLELRDLGLDRLQRARVVRAVAGLHDERADAADHVVRVAEGRVRLLQPGDAVVDVALELLGVRQLVAQRERPAGAERVVLRPVICLPVDSWFCSWARRFVVELRSNSVWRASVCWVTRIISPSRSRYRASGPSWRSSGRPRCRRAGTG